MISVYLLAAVVILVLGIGIIGSNINKSKAHH